ncbi:hypothetical protein [Williamsia deligens]|uniref:RecT family protein n=1 Tax=Williamsia deligens TaxID=321325 RepID=A0ABW3GGK4_9NOCA|nr:hypothetical protein [Williamsia deligens]MCP2196310.1 hypothetical protein [Williamsia deligens]
MTSTEITQQAESEVLPAVLAPAAANSAQSRADQLAALQAEAEFLEVAYGLAEKACGTALVAEHFRNKPADGAIAVAFGASLGWHWTKSLQDVYVVKGKPSIMSKEMRELMIRAGHDVWEEEVGPTRVVLAGRRRDSDIVVRVEWTIEKAEAAGLVTANPNYKKYPENMLYARCTTDLAKRLAPDALSGLGIVEEQQDRAAAARRVDVTVARDNPQANLRAMLGGPQNTPSSTDDGEPAAGPESVQQAAPRTRQPKPKTITEAQMKKMHALLNEKGLADRATGLAWISACIEREITTSKDLTVDEAAKVITTLQNDGEIPADGQEG